MTDGRLDINEYGERSARASAATTRGEVLALFDDLPAPHPVFGQQAAAPARPAPAGSTVPQQAQQQAPVPVQQNPLGQRLLGAAVPVSAVLALVLFVTVVHTWWIFLLP